MRTLPFDRNFDEKLRNINTGSEHRLQNALRNNRRIAPVLPVPFPFQYVREMKGGDENYSDIWPNARYGFMNLFE
jgi:hypothetical protein